jgi:KTSC domain
MKKFAPSARWVTFVVLLAGVCPANAETVSVKYRGEVDLAPFACEAITRSSFIERVCYDAKNAYMLINLSGTWYHYCEIGQGTVSSLLEAESMGRFYNASIKGNFDCRTHRIPAY